MNIIFHIQMSTSTGISSYTIGFETAHSNGCQQSNTPCTLGVYENLTSSTPKWVSNDYGNGVIDHGYGSYINDTLSYTLSGNGTRDPPIVLPNFQVGTLDTFYASFVLPAPTGWFLRARSTLYERDVIPRCALSIYLGKDEPLVDYALLVINGQDIAKQASAPFTVPMVSPQDMNSAGAVPSLFYVNVTSFTLIFSVANATTASETLRPTVDNNSDIQTRSDRSVSQYFHISTNSSNSDPYTVECDFENVDLKENKINVYFNPGRDLVSIPLASLVSTFGPDKCAVWLDGGGNLHPADLGAV
ncbi:uncharacterized protein TRUGW13939_06869 [Talaromyces rugulosus]|uniref:Peptidase A1 domain-containing protein n=1 Tax=Talaromyces rugulosus TaxID=121627 RepID=A0A7H8R0G2_TALRU|nr:uncharacterized protein TRUGW13939_06869 [Talaromyces rugulosus]QKX59727.1 hypothetical protein TRUGW13939_06869 [Talaromyces rugulosus]